MNVPTYEKIVAMVRFICGFFDREWDLARFRLLERQMRLKNYDGPGQPGRYLCRVVADGVRCGELRPLDAMLAAALLTGPVVQAATFRTYRRLTGALSNIADEIVCGFSTAVAKQGD